MANELEICVEASKELAAAVVADEEQRGGATKYASSKLLSDPKAELNKRWSEGATFRESATDPFRRATSQLGRGANR